MLRPIRRAVVAPLGIALVALLALPLAVLANTSEAIAQTGGMTVTLPMPGSGLTVAIKLDVVGNVSQVDLDPVGTYSRDQGRAACRELQERRRDLAGQDQGQGRQALGQGVRTDARLVRRLRAAGRPTCSGPATATTVGYTVGDDGGKPTIAIDSVNAPGDIAVVQGTPKSKTGSEGLERLGPHRLQPRRLHQEARHRDLGQGDRRSRRQLQDHAVRQGPAEAHAARWPSWPGRGPGPATCATAPRSASRYTVVDDGTDGSVVFGAGQRPGHEQGRQARDLCPVRRHHGPRSTVSLHEKKDGTWALKVSTRTPKCRHQPAADPGVNTPIDPNAGSGRRP